MAVRKKEELAELAELADVAELAEWLENGINGGITELATPGLPSKETLKCAMF